MSKFKVTPLISLFIMSLIFYSWVGYSQPPSPRVQLITEPSMGQIFPFEAEAKRPQFPVKLTLQAVDERGKALENAKMHLTILTPPKNPWFTTDFPIVEGTELLNMEANAPQGELQIQQMLPIRGNYQLLVSVTPLVENAFAPIQETLTLPVAENGVKYRNFAILAVILLAVGLGGGWIIGAEQAINLGEIVPQRVRLLLSGVIVVAIASLLYLNISAEFTESHHHAHYTHQAVETNNSGVVESEEIQVQLLGERSGTVGKPAQFQVQVTDAKTHQPIREINWNIKATQLEDEWVTFAYQGVGNASGTLTWQQQFFDGESHNLEVKISPKANAKRQFQPFQISQKIDVEGIAPPLPVRLITLAYLTGFVVIGLLLGMNLPKNTAFLRLARKSSEIT